MPFLQDCEENTLQTFKWSMLIWNVFYSKSLIQIPKEETEAQRKDRKLSKVTKLAQSQNLDTHSAKSRALSALIPPFSTWFPYQKNKTWTLAFCFPFLPSPGPCVPYWLRQCLTGLFLERGLLGGKLSPKVILWIAPNLHSLSCLIWASSAHLSWALRTPVLVLFLHSCALEQDWTGVE